MVNASTVNGNGKAPHVWTLGRRTFTRFDEFLKARDRRNREFLIAAGIKPEELAPPFEVPESTTPENFNREPRWPVSEAIDRALDNHYRLVSAAELDASNYQPRYLIPGILVAGEPGGIYGPAKSLKTSLAADLLISLASGTAFLGRFPVPEPGRVIFFSGRAGFGAMQSLARSICRERGLSLASLENFSFSTSLPRLDRGVDLMALRELLEREKPVCIVIDPVDLALSAEKRRDPFALSEFLDSFGELCHSMGCALLIVHHCKRSIKVGRPATLDDVAGSGVAEFSAQWLLVSRRRPYDPGSGHHELWLSAGNGAGHQGLWALDVEEGSESPLPDEGPIALADADSPTWKTTLRSVAWAEARADEQAAQRKEEHRLRRWAATYTCHRARVLEYLAAFPAGRTANGIRDALGINGLRMKRILDELIKEGLLATDEIEHPKRNEIVYLRTPKADLSMAAVKAGEINPPDEMQYEIRSGQFRRGIAPAPGAAGAGSDGEPSAAGSSDCVLGAREKSGPETCADSPAAPSPPAPLPRGERGEERPAVPDAMEAPQSAEKSGPDTLLEGCATQTPAQSDAGCPTDTGAEQSLDEVRS
jgi:DNA-binding MarR family transcriptional regulator